MRRASVTVQDVTREDAPSIDAVERSTAQRFHPQDVAALAVGDDGRSAAAPAVRDVMYVHTHQPEVVAHQVDENVVGFGAQ